KSTPVAVRSTKKGATPASGFAGARGASCAGRPPACGRASSAPATAARRSGASVRHAGSATLALLRAVGRRERRHLLEPGLHPPGVQLHVLGGAPARPLAQELLARLDRGGRVAERELVARELETVLEVGRVELRELAQDAPPIGRVGRVRARDAVVERI